MSLWSWLRGRSDTAEDAEARSGGPTPLPTEPYVFECRQCGKVFDARRRRSRCPECDSEDVERLG